jgi:hypothetical protein
MKIQFDKNIPINILCLGAHCDDIEIGAGGTLLKLFNKYTLAMLPGLFFLRTK